MKSALTVSVEAVAFAGVVLDSEIGVRVVVTDSFDVVLVVCS